MATNTAQKVASNVVPIAKVTLSTSTPKLGFIWLTSWAEIHTTEFWLLRENTSFLRSRS